MSPSLLAVARMASVGLNAAETSRSPRPESSSVRRPVRVSQSRTTPSLPAVASCAPSALKATPLTRRPWPRRMRLPWPVAESQICAPPSLPTVSSWLSPGRKAHAQAVPRWSSGCWGCRAIV